MTTSSMFFSEQIVSPLMLQLACTEKNRAVATDPGVIPKGKEMGVTARVELEAHSSLFTIRAKFRRNDHHNCAALESYIMAHTTDLF